MKLQKTSEHTKLIFYCLNFCKKESNLIHNHALMKDEYMYFVIKVDDGCCINKDYYTQQIECHKLIMKYTV